MHRAALRRAAAARAHCCYADADIGRLPRTAAASDAARSCAGTADARPPVDASYDWHGLLIAPFGSVLKDIPLTLHEVLLFRDEAHGSRRGR